MEMCKCSKCGKVYEEYELVDTDEGLICESCIEEYFTQCESCSEYHLLDDMCTTDDDYCICENCYENYTYECNECGRIFYGGDTYLTAQGEVCENCIEEYFTRCDCCSDYCHSDNMYTTDDGYCICENCYENCTYECNECGGIFYEEDALTDGYCENCRDNAVIKSYYYKPDPVFFGEGSYHFGVELEIEVEDGYSKSAMATAITEELNNIIYCKNDGSLDYGFEIVTHPLTFNFIKKFDIFEKIEKTLRGKCRSFNKAGMHIHISKTAFKDQLHLKRFIEFINLNEKFSVLIAQRHSTRWAEYLSKEQIEKHFKTGWCPSRYHAINLENENTIEVRIFNGNLLSERLYKNVEFIEAVIRFTKTAAPLKASEFLNFIENKEEFSNLREFLTLRKNSLNKILKGEENV